MIYFKHYSNASDNKSLNRVFDKYGHTGIAFWWMLLELCSEHWDGHSEPEFEFHQRTVATKLKSTPNKVKTWLELCSDLGMCAFGKNETQLTIKLPKLLEIKTSRTVVRSNKKQLPVYKEEKRREEKRREEKGKSVNVFMEQIEKIYKTQYRGKEGKKRGMEILAKTIKSQADVDLFKRGVENYNKSLDKTGLNCKHFSTFCNQEEWRSLGETSDRDLPLRERMILFGKYENQDPQPSDEDRHAYYKELGLG